MAFARELAGHGSSDVPGSVGSSSIGVPGAAASAALAPPLDSPGSLQGKQASNHWPWYRRSSFQLPMFPVCDILVSGLVSFIMPM